MVPLTHPAMLIATLQVDTSLRTSSNYGSASVVVNEFRSCGWHIPVVKPLRQKKHFLQLQGINGACRIQSGQGPSKSVHSLAIAKLVVSDLHPKVNLQVMTPVLLLVLTPHFTTNCNAHAE
jgi:hypothetical protein